MIHLGDITKLNGAEIPVVDIITGGSPCQNLSQAGNRKGLEGDESKLFFEQIRIVKEMREHDRATGRTGFLVRPRYMVWENVAGAMTIGSLFDGIGGFPLAFESAGAKALWASELDDFCIAVTKKHFGEE